MSTNDPEQLAEFLTTHRTVVALTGAGISQASGIPTYRDNSGKWLSRTPIQEQDFLRDEHTRKRYWARAYYGWPTVRDAQPNTAHEALARLEQRGQLELLITQNVDRLHQQAGSQNVVDLHGRIDQVRCLGCARKVTREEVQIVLNETNQLPQEVPQSPRPDGDMDVPNSLIDTLVLPKCTDCGDDLMPDVVFFGGNVPSATVKRCMNSVEAADALLVVGSSLTVFSGFRFCRAAHRLGKTIAIINPGVTRADDMAALRLHCAAAPLLQKVISL